MAIDDNEISISFKQDSQLSFSSNLSSNSLEIGEQRDQIDIEKNEENEESEEIVINMISNEGDEEAPENTSQNQNRNCTSLCKGIVDYFSASDN